MARLVIVSGAPGAGKTTLARQLGPQLGMPVLCRDDIKEALMHALGAGTEEQSAQLGRASFRILFSVARTLLESGVDVVIEANFRRGLSEVDLNSLLQTADGVVVHCHSTGLAERFLSRRRHPGHHSAEVAARMERETAAGVFDSPDLEVPVIRVDCTAGWSPPLAGVVAFVNAGVPAG